MKIANFQYQKVIVDTHIKNRKVVLAGAVATTKEKSDLWCEHQRCLNNSPWAVRRALPHHLLRTLL